MDTKKLQLDIDEQRNLTRKYAPFIPQMRPWLVIVEVNMSNPSNNGTECTGKNVRRETYCDQHYQCLGAVLSPWWIISSRSCVCGDKYACSLDEIQSKRDPGIWVYPGFKYIRSQKDSSRCRTELSGELLLNIIPV